MIDMHSHILPNIDDGSKNIEQSLQLLKEASDAGFTDIVSTSHYLEGYYEEDVEKRKELLNILIDSSNTNLKLHLGSEIYISEKIIELIRENKASTINNSRYVLFELPMNNNVLYLKDIIFTLIENDFIPIIAHPERYSFVQKNPSMLVELIQMGVLFQSNYGSIVGYYGKDAEKTVKILLKNNLVHFLGSDVHRPNTIYKMMPNILKKLEKLIGKEKLYEISTYNPSMILQDYNIDVNYPQNIKLSFWDKIIK